MISRRVAGSRNIATSPLQGSNCSVRIIIERCSVKGKAVSASLFLRRVFLRLDASVLGLTGATFELIKPSYWRLR